MCAPERELAFTCHVTLTSHRCHTQTHDADRSRDQHQHQGIELQVLEEEHESQAYHSLGTSGRDSAFFGLRCWRGKVLSCATSPRICGLMTISIT